MDQTLVLEQDEQVSTLASNPAFTSALKDININLSIDFKANYLPLII
jgi:hypothetical protein